jgi:hypothetical protein
MIGVLLELAIVDPFVIEMERIVFVLVALGATAIAIVMARKGRRK